jgi:hypothetical protein
MPAGQEQQKAAALRAEPGVVEGCDIRVLLLLLLVPHTVLLLLVPHTVLLLLVPHTVTVGTVCPGPAWAQICTAYRGTVHFTMSAACPESLQVVSLLLLALLTVLRSPRTVSV